MNILNRAKKILSGETVSHGAFERKIEFSTLGYGTREISEDFGMHAEISAGNERGAFGRGIGGGRECGAGSRLGDERWCGDGSGLGDGRKIGTGNRIGDGRRVGFGILAGGAVVLGGGGRLCGRFLRAWLRQYALPLALATGLHVALLLGPGGSDGVRAGVARVEEDGTEERVYALIDLSRAPAVVNRGNAGAASAEANAGGAALREALSAAVAAQNSDALSQVASDAEAWVTDQAALPDGSGFDALGAIESGLALSDGFGVFGGEGFSMGMAPGPGSGVVGKRFGAGVVAATFTPEPVYPELARREGREGMVEMDVMVGASGRARVAEVVKSSGHADLDGAARSTVLAAWRFKRGEPGARRVCSVRIAFSLRGR